MANEVKKGGGGGNNCGVLQTTNFAYVVIVGDQFTPTYTACGQHVVVKANDICSILRKYFLQTLSGYRACSVDSGHGPKLCVSYTVGTSVYWGVYVRILARSDVRQNILTWPKVASQMCSGWCTLHCYLWSIHKCWSKTNQQSRGDLSHGLKVHFGLGI